MKPIEGERVDDWARGRRNDDVQCLKLKRLLAAVTCRRGYVLYLVLFSTLRRADLATSSLAIRRKASSSVSSSACWPASGATIEISAEGSSG